MQRTTALMHSATDADERGSLGRLAARYAGATTAAPGVVPQPRTGEVPPQVQEWWDEWTLTGATTARTRLIEHYAALVSAVARRVAMQLPAHVDLDDLTQAGMFGLMDAVDKFEAGRGVKFESYAALRVRGSILDELRAGDWVPRSVRARARAIAQVTDEAVARGEDRPSEQQVAAAVGLDVAQVRDVCSSVANGCLASIDQLIGDGAGGTDLRDRIADLAAGPHERVEDQEVRYVMARAVEALPERERLVVVLSFYENLPMARIGAVLGVTESRVSQLRTAAVSHLRAAMLHAEVL